MSKTKYLVEGIEIDEGWCFDVAFWVQLALLERTHHENHIVTVDFYKDRIAVRAKRTIVTTYKHGVKTTESGVKARIEARPLHDDIYSKRAVLAWARDVVSRMQFVEWQSDVTNT